MFPFRSLHLSAALAVAVCFTGSKAPAGEIRPLSAEEAAGLQKVLVPESEAAWQKVPWKLSILEARDEAAREKKPIFMLVRSGHPLGCV